MGWIAKLFGGALAKKALENLAEACLNVLERALAPELFERTAVRVLSFALRKLAKCTATTLDDDFAEDVIAAIENKKKPDGGGGGS